MADPWELASPLDYRYGRQPMRAIFSLGGRLAAQARVEGALALAQASIGAIPLAEAQRIDAVCRNLEAWSPSRVHQIEMEIHHDIMALVRTLAESAGPNAGGFIHLGATSNDIIDTGSALQITAGLALLEEELREQVVLGERLARAHKTTIMMGRTHGQWALPTTFGLKMAVHIDEVLRHLQRLHDLYPRIAVGKLTGAVGTAAGLGPRARELELRLMESLGLSAAIATTQVLQRDRYVELVSVIANICATMEKLATEVRLLQRSEVGEVSEFFDTERQVGSSTMAHKRNPILAENICSLSRVVRGYLIPVFENVPMWHERDLTNSASERLILPHVFLLADEVVGRTNTLLRRLQIHPERMRQTIDSSKGMIMAEAVMLALVRAGLGRQDAHELVRQSSMRAQEDGRSLQEVLAELPEVRGSFTDDDWAELFEATSYIGRAPQIVDEVIARASEHLQRPPTFGALRWSPKPLPAPPREV